MSGIVRIRARSPDPPGHYVDPQGQRWPRINGVRASFADVTVHVVDDEDGHETELLGVSAISFVASAETHGTRELEVTMRLCDFDLDVEARALLHDDDLAVCLEGLIEAAESATLALPEGRAAELIAAAKQALERRTLDKVLREGGP